VINNKKGFTLIEIIISISLILIVGVSTTVFVVSKNKNNELEKISKNVLESAQLYLENEFDENGKTYKTGLLTGGNAVVIPLNELEEKGYLSTNTLKTLEDNDISKEEYILAGVFEDAKELCSSSDNVIEFETSWSDKLKGLEDPIYICGKTGSAGSSFEGNDLLTFLFNSYGSVAIDNFDIEGGGFETLEKLKDDWDFEAIDVTDLGDYRLIFYIAPTTNGLGEPEIEVGIDLTAIYFHPITSIIEYFSPSGNVCYAFRGDINYNYVKIKDELFRIVGFKDQENVDEDDYIITLIANNTYETETQANNYVNSIFEGEIENINVTENGEYNFRNLTIDEIQAVGALEFYHFYQKQDDFCNNYILSQENCLQSVKKISFDHWLNNKPIFLTNDNMTVLSSKSSGLIVDKSKNIYNIQLEDKFYYRPVVDIKLSSIKSYDGIGTEYSPFILNF